MSRIVLALALVAFVGLYLGLFLWLLSGAQSVIDEDV